MPQRRQMGLASSHFTLRILNVLSNWQTPEGACRYLRARSLACTASLLRLVVKSFLRYLALVSASVLILAHELSVGMELLPVNEHVHMIGRQELSAATERLPVNERARMIGRPRRQPIWSHYEVQ